MTPVNGNLQNIKKISQKMVLSSQTNRVYFSRLLSADYKPLYEKMTGALHQHGIETGLLEGTKDY